jgi:Male sterility protein
VEFLHADFYGAHLGLSEEPYHRLAQGVDLIIHNAWPVDFNRHFFQLQASTETTGFLQVPPDRAVRFPKTKSPELEAKQTLRVGATLRKMGLVTTEWVDLFMRLWDWGIDSLMYVYVYGVRWYFRVYWLVMT